MLGWHPYKSALEVYCEKVGITVASTTAANEAALWGQLWKTENGRPQAHPEQIDKLDEVAA